MGFLSGIFTSPKKIAKYQQRLNESAAQTGTRLNRFDYENPYGSVSWEVGGPNFRADEYDAAYDAWYNAGGTRSGQKAPNKTDFGYDPNIYKQIETYDPRIIELMDAQLATSKGMQGSIDTALGRVNDWLGRDLPTRQELRDEVDPRYRNLSPFIDMLGENAMNSSELFGDQIDRLDKLYGEKFNYNKAPPMPEANEQARQAVEDALYGRATARLDPRFATQEDQTRARLAAQGITEGSEAYNREMRDFNFAKNDAYSSAMNDSTAAGIEAMQRLFGMGMSARQQGVQEANFMRQLPTQEALAAMQLNAGAQGDLRGMVALELQQNMAKANEIAAMFNLDKAGRDQVLNELNALRTGAQVQGPQMASGIGGGQQVQAADYLGAVNSGREMFTSLTNAVIGGASRVASAGMSGGASGAGGGGP